MAVIPGRLHYNFSFDPNVIEISRFQQEIEQTGSVEAKELVSKALEYYSAAVTLANTQGIPPGIQGCVALFCYTTAKALITAGSSDEAYKTTLAKIETAAEQILAVLQTDLPTLDQEVYLGLGWTPESRDRSSLRSLRKKIISPTESLSILQLVQIIAIHKVVEINNPQATDFREATMRAAELAMKQLVPPQTGANLWITEDASLQKAYDVVRKSINKAEMMPIEISVTRDPKRSESTLRVITVLCTYPHLPLHPCGDDELYQIVEYNVKSFASSDAVSVSRRARYAANNVFITLSTSVTPESFSAYMQTTVPEGVITSMQKVALFLPQLYKVSFVSNTNAMQPLSLEFLRRVTEACKNCPEIVKEHELNHIVELAV